MPKVSVIIPIYNVEKYIEKCARSLFEQTLDDIEYLFINDCTPDESIEVLEAVLEEYPYRKDQVIIHSMEENKGQAAVREWGMQNAKGDYIIHCDSDDWVDRDTYRLMYGKAIDEGADIVVCDFIISDGKNNVRRGKGAGAVDKTSFINRLLFQQDVWALWNKLVRRDICNKNIVFPIHNMGEDMALVFQYVINSKTIAYEPMALYYYRNNPTSIIHAASEEKLMNNFYQNIGNAEIVVDIFERCGITHQFNRGLVNIKWQIKKQLWKTRFDRKKFNIWKATYPEINWSLFFVKEIKLTDKIKFLLTQFTLYP